MKVNIKSIKEMGAVGKAVRKSQDFDQRTLGDFSNNGINFVSQFENGKSTVQIGRVLEIFEILGIGITLDLPVPFNTEDKKKLTMLLEKSGVNIVKDLVLHEHSIITSDH
ncbi:transcriptional regulator [Pseudoalteromonas sp. NBT06-2]|uniref:transcriptional regulator n=1 Tax=Pseudoalteromonas sp. NBT06-2 TaxID=2025950 RepID=UPI001BAF59C2|nr:transcriptional regulator [Pseudoalteromonas sp. NBT06-2]